MIFKKTAKIIKIIDGTHIVINKGANDEIKSGDVFRIFGNHGQEVKDPETGVVLGSLDSYKGKIVAQTVYEKMTICSSIPKDYVRDALGSFPLKGYHPELNIDPEEITGGFAEVSDTKIKIGDTVESELG